MPFGISSEWAPRYVAKHMRALLHPIFSLAILLLLLNDHLWKAAYGNWFTGKLSDLVGLFAFAVVLETLWRVGRKQHTPTFPWGVVSAGIFFTWFKSPLSGPVLSAVDDWSGLSFTRVVDYTDLIALSILYPALRLVEGATNKSTTVLPRRALAAILPVTLVAFVATSVDDDDLLPPLVGCCGQGPQVITVGGGLVYVPTAFTPDGDGLNDIFQVGVNDSILKLDSFVIYNNYRFEPVYREYDVTDFSPGTGFDGSGLDSLPPQEFYYIIGVTSIDSVAEVIYGHVCALPCKEPTDKLLPAAYADSCTYGNQFSPTIGYDSLIVSGERLECFQ